MLTKEEIQACEEVLIEELQPAMGCTEPIAIAYGAAIIGDLLPACPERVQVELSGNIIKNVKSVIVPSSGGLHGIKTAVAAGLLAKCPQKRLEVLSALDETAHDKILQLAEHCDIHINELVSPCTFDLFMEGRASKDKATVRISERHTGVVCVTKNGEDVTEKYRESGVIPNSAHADKSCLTVEKIVEFVNTCDLSKVRPSIEKQMKMNMAIAEEGLQGDYGASIGKLLYKNGQVEVTGKAKAYAAAGSDARMSGCELPVCIISGSGNQGITTCVPVMVYARELGIDEERLFKAVVVADLITAHLKDGIGCLSAYCGAISAGVAAGAGICYLLGGDFWEIAHTIVNALAILSGTICDGAKPSCAAKIAMAVEAGIMGYEMAKTNRQFVHGDGIVTKGVENTIKNVGILAREGMQETDKKIISIMLKGE